MFELIVGETRSKKGSYIRNRIKNAKGTVVIFDLKNNFQDIDGFRVDLGLIDPHKEPLSYEDAVAINAATIEYLSLIDDRAIDVLKDNTPKGKDWKKSTHQNLIKESIHRSVNSWNQNENQNAFKIKRFLNFNKSKQNLSVSEVVQKMKEHRTIILESNDLLSTEIRIVLFFLLRRFQKECPSFMFISDNINNIWKEGNLINFVKVFDFKEIESIFSFNKTANVPKTFMDYAELFTVFKLESNADFNDLKNLGLDIPDRVKKFKVGEYLHIEKDKANTA